MRGRMPRAIVVPSFYYAKELAYVESSGTQYIDTLFKPNQDTRVVMDIETGGVSSTKALFGCRNAASPTASLAYMVWQQTALLRSDYFGTYASADGAFTTRMTVDKNKNVCSLGDVTVTNTYKTAQAELNMYLLACNNSGTATLQYLVSAKLYSCQIYDNGTLIRDFIPVLDFDGVACLFDKVEKKLYYNAGSGSFSYAEVV